MVPATNASAQAAPPSVGTVGIRLLEGPIVRQDDPRAHTYIIDSLAPGATITRRIEINNSTLVPQTLQLYPGGAEIRDGAFVAQDGSAANDLPGWITVTPGVIGNMAPNTVAPGTITIAVPANATPGERYGAVWVQPPASLPSSGGVVEVNRVGIRVYLSVAANGAEPASDFVVDTLAAYRNLDGSRFVTAQVHNTGGRALDLTGGLTLTNGPGGLSAGPLPAQLGPTLGIGQSEPVLVPIDSHIPDGEWDLKLTLQSGVLQRSAIGELEFPMTAGESRSAVPIEGPAAALTVPAAATPGREQPPGGLPPGGPSLPAKPAVHRNLALGGAYDQGLIGLGIFLLVFCLVFWPLAWARRRLDDDDPMPPPVAIL
jgi:hypothetical protein